MPLQVWIQTHKENVQKIKLILEEAGQLNKAQKVKLGAQDGYMILPTNTYCHEEFQDEAGYFQILSDLHLSSANRYSAAEIVYLPSQPPGPETSESKLGPIQEAISEWLETLPELSLWKTGTMKPDLLEHSPKRWSVYEPMLLLPSGSFQDTIWKALLQALDENHLSSLWTRILYATCKKEGRKDLTHLAINSGIPPRQDPPNTSQQDNHTGIPTRQSSSSSENILRSPSGLLLLHGDFGPALSAPPALAPTARDLAAAFWVSTKQNGIVQTWAPRYTMFSRGNIKEKARILAFRGPETAPAGAGKQAARGRGVGAAVDLYAGIGYFVFSYAAAGFGKVLCWEINPWSVEGLRRGCFKNGWSCRIVRGSELDRPMLEILSGEEMVVVFEEGNERAAGRIEEIRKWEEQEGERVLGDVLHVNCGFLPSSEASWRTAWEIVYKSGSAWLHLHENVGVDDLEKRKKEIEGMIGKWAKEEGAPKIEVEHVELVKTFAPGVWHCVFDVHVQLAQADSS